jgi:hypothetical protein
VNHGSFDVAPIVDAPAPPLMLEVMVESWKSISDPTSNGPTIQL